MSLKSILLATALICVPAAAFSQSASMPSSDGLGHSLDQQVLARGQLLYEEIAACNACHGDRGEGGTAPALNIDAALPTEIVYQLKTNPQMAGIADLLEPLNEDDLFALSMYLRELAGLPNDPTVQQDLIQSVMAAMRGDVKVTTFALSQYDRMVQEIESWETLVSQWERKAKTGPIKSDYELKVLETFDAGEPKFTPEPGKTYWYENTGISTSMFGPSNKPLGSDSTHVVVGDAETKDVIASYKIPRSLKGDVHTTLASPDGKFIYIIGGKPEGGVESRPTLETPATLMKVDALTLQPVESYDIGGRIHHGQLFRDRYLLIDTFARDPEGLDIFLIDPETKEIIGGVRDEDLGGSSYTAFTDNEYIYILMQPSGYAPSAISGYLAGLKHNSGDLVHLRPFWVAKLDPDTWEVVEEYPYPAYRGDWIVIDSAKEHMYIPAGASSTVTKINLATGEKVWTAPSGIGPYGAALTADEKQLWVADKGETTGMFGRTVTVMDTETGRLVETLFSGYQVDHILLSPNGKEMWGTSNGEGRIYVWDVETREQLKVIDMPENGDAHGLVFIHYDEDGNPAVVRDQGGFHNGINPALGNPVMN